MNQTYTSTLTIIECYACHMDFGMTPDFERARRRDHAGFYCPAGHRQVFLGKSDLEREREKAEQAEREAVRLRARVDQERSRSQRMEHRVRAMKGVVTKTKARIAAGKCIRCSHEFPDLVAHMAEAHPGYAE